MKLKITNLKRFIISISSIFAIIIFLLIILSKSIYSNSEVNYKEEVISTGDTLWAVAENLSEENDYYKNKDVRYIIQDLKNINQLEDYNLKDGQLIKIPFYM